MLALAVVRRGGELLVGDGVDEVAYPDSDGGPLLYPEGALELVRIP